MRRWMAAPVVFAAAAALALTGDPRPAAAQPPAPNEESFFTADGVRLKGLFHKAAKAAEGNPVVMLLYPPGAGNNMNKGDWGGLANALNDKGFHVFRFDWRGHGKSTDITDTQVFWTNAVTGGWNNRYIAGANRKPVKNTLAVAKGEIRAQYFPVYVNDLAAARNHLDQMSDKGTIPANTSSIYLIGAGDAATLGMLWLTAEWVRPAVHPTLLNGQTYKIVPTAEVVLDPTSTAGMDVGGAVWLTATRAQTVPARTIERWAEMTPKLRDNNPMLFLYGDRDAAGERQTKFFHDVVLVGNGDARRNLNKLVQTFATPIKGGGKSGTTLSGVGLLGNNATLKTEDTILDFLAARQKDRAALAPKARNYPGPYFINLAFFGLAP